MRQNRSPEMATASARLAANRSRRARLQRVVVVAAQHFHVGDPQTDALRGGEHLGERGRVGARKDILADERTGGARRRHAADTVHQRDAIVSQQLADLAEIFSEMTDADVLHHADGDHAVETGR